MSTSLKISDVNNNMIETPRSLPGQSLNDLSARTMREVEVAILTAKRFPRDEDNSLRSIRKACQRTRLAESAIYQYPRANQTVQGPSIRLAETIALHWGNIHKGVKEIEANEESTTYEAFAYDLESNVRASRVFTVQHVRYSRKGKTKLIDPRDIYEVVMSHGARRLRACILEVIPQDIVEEAMEICEKTLISLESDCPLEERIEKMISYFKTNHNVPSELITSRFSKNIEAFNVHDVLELKKIAQSLKDGMSKPSDWFSEKESNKENKPQRVNNLFKKDESK